MKKLCLSNIIKRITLLIAWGSGTLAVFYVLVLFLIKQHDLECFFRPVTNDAFKKTEWQSGGFQVNSRARGNGTNFGLRYKMVDNLIQSKVLIGKSEASVRALLGEPDAGILRRGIISMHEGRTSYNEVELNPSVKTDIQKGISFWSYFLGNQSDYPARFILLPGAFYNFGRWKLILKMEAGMCCSAEVSF